MRGLKEGKRGSKATWTYPNRKSM